MPGEKILGAFALLGLAATVSGGDDTLFESRVRPVLVGTCFRCHGGEKTRAKLRVDSREALLKGGESGPAIRPGQPEKSPLIQALRHEGDGPRMPPDKPLSPATVAAFSAWVKAGAPWPTNSTAFTADRTTRVHWAYLPLRAGAAPDSSETALGPIDRFLDAKLREKGLRPVGPADRRTLIRRATFDLTGLPPTPWEVEDFLADASPTAFARVVDRLLASPRYGERWGRHWLDVVRYADTAGETADYPVPQAWRYRNYVIDAINADKPYDEFLREQLAGDILARQLPPDASPARYAELITATGYISIARRFGFDVAVDHYLTIDDTVDTLGKSVLGLALGCARCHDHKYDPISVLDYYGLYGIFESTRYPLPGSEKVRTQRDLVSLRSPSEVRPGQRQTDQGLKAYAVGEGKPHNVRVHRRGDPQTLGEEAPRRFLEVLGGQSIPPEAGSGRLQLAGFLTDPRNPLTTRVMVNRIWQGHFGAGLVKTPNDFGTRGEPPTHPELLDYLAKRFIKSGWSLKAMHRLLMNTAAYQRASGHDPAGAQVDPDNAMLGRFNRRRLSGEEIRDAMLAVSGDLDPTPGGPHPFPDEKSWGFTQHAPFAAVYDHNRRSVYLMTQRIKRHPFLGLFDGADTSSSTGVRLTTTVPTQALFFMNDPFVHTRSSALAARLVKLPDDTARLARASWLLYGRPPTARDTTTMTLFLADAAADAIGAAAAWSAWLRVMLCSNEFVYVD
jgi:hypothetical protein